MSSEHDLDLIVSVSVRHLFGLIQKAEAAGKAVAAAPAREAPAGDHPAHWKMFSAREQDILNVLSDGQTRSAKQIASLAKYENSAAFGCCLTNLCEREILTSCHAGYAIK